MDSSYKQIGSIVYDLETLYKEYPIYYLEGYGYTCPTLITTNGNLDILKKFETIPGFTICWNSSLLPKTLE